MIEHISAPGFGPLRFSLERLYGVWHLGLLVSGNGSVTVNLGRWELSAYWDRYS